MHSFKKLGKWPTKADRLGCQQTRMNPKKNGSKSTPLESFLHGHAKNHDGVNEQNRSSESHKVPIVQSDSTKPSGGPFHVAVLTHPKPSQNVPCPGRGRNRALVRLRRELQGLFLVRAFSALAVLWPVGPAR